MGAMVGAMVEGSLPKLNFSSLGTVSLSEISPFNLFKLKN